MIKYNNDFLLYLNNDNNIKICSVKIAYFSNKIIINNDNSDKHSATTFFHQKNGFPMKLSIESFLLY